jgi:biopolymer transport protein ExbD
MQTGEEAGEPNLVPLLDLVFQLIMFFMITVNFVRLDQINEEVSLPMAQSAVPLDTSAEEFVFLNINKDGKLVGTLEELNGGRKLEEYLKNLMIHLERKARIQGDKSEPKIVMVLRADKDARYKQIWDYLEIGKSAGIKRYQFRALKGS